MLNSYQDRGLIKWSAFDALNGFNSMLKEMKHRLNKKEKPALSEDDFYNFNLTLQEAIVEDKEVQLIFFENGYSKITFGKINKLDFNKKEIILKTKETINAYNIIDIEII